MATATINGVPFPINPSSVRWDYSVSHSTQKTIGGKVIQLYGWRMGDLVIGGSFGDLARQMAFFEVLKGVADAQVPTLDRKVPQPVRFLWPERNWDFWVYLRGVTQNGAGVTIESRQNVVQPTYTMKLFVAEDNGNIVEAAKNAAQVAYINRLTAGLGWKKSSWNGPIDLEDLSQQMLGLTPIDFFLSEFGKAQVTPTTTTDSTPGVGLGSSI